MPREKSLEDRCVDAAKMRGALVHKLSPKVDKGIPDRLMMFPGGVVWFIEFKKDDKQMPTPMQRKWQRDLEQRGHNYALIASFDVFAQLVLNVRLV